MAELETLIRVRKHDVEERQKILAELYRYAQDLQDERDALEAQRAIERAKIKDIDPLLQSSFASYSKSVDLKLEDIDEQREKMEQRITRAQEDVRSAFADLKKIEIIDERRKAQLLAEVAKKEAAFLEEVALDQYRRNQDDY